MIDYRLIARIREAKDKNVIPPGVIINYKLLGKVLEEKARRTKVG